MKKFLFTVLFLFLLLLACAPINLIGTRSPQAAAPVTALTEALQSLESCRSSAGVVSAGNTYSFSCSNSADTIYTVAMTDYGSQAAAGAQFESDRGGQPTACFHGYDQYEISPASSPGQPDRILSTALYWQAGQWLVSISASYDYGFFHYNTGDFAEAVYAAGVEQGLFPAGTCQ